MWLILELGSVLAGVVCFSNPGFGMATAATSVVPPVEQRLGETNKGHQLLMKMGQ